MLIPVGLFVSGAGLVAYAGPKLSKEADKLGIVTGLGHTLAGIIFLGASTSLPGLIVSFETALKGQANLAVSNSIGSIAAQTFFIAIADVALRKAKLARQETLSSSLLQSTVVIALLSLISIAMIAPELKIWHIHPITPVIILFILVGFKFIQDIKEHPVWVPEEIANEGNRRAESEEESGKHEEKTVTENKTSIYKTYAFHLILVGTGGWLISYGGGKIMEATKLSQVITGATLMAITSSLPELVTAISAVRNGNISLAIGDIVGGNAFDTIMVAVADLVYTEGSIFKDISTNVTFLVSLVILLTVIMLVGFIRRDKKGFKNVGLESAVVIVFYLTGIAIIIFAQGAFKG